MKTEMSIGRYACYLSVALVLLCGLTALLSSCERDLPGEDSGRSKKIELSFTLGGLSEGAGGTELRSEGAEPETVVVPLEDGSCLYATLESDPADRLRAQPETIKDNARVMIVAYRSDGSYVDAAEYKVIVPKDGTIAPAAVSGRGISVPAAGKYHFVAYTYNNETSPPAYSASPITVALRNENDLFWGKVENVSVQDGSNMVPIKGMKHKFSRVKIKVAALSNISSVNNATLGTVYNGSLNLLSGQMNNGSEASPSTVSFMFRNLNTPVVTSDPRLVFTKGELFTVKMESMTMGGKEKKNISVTFKKTSLEEGKEYTLSLNVKTGIAFAASNIYWDGSKLTFDKDENTPASTVQKQGVFFKFGSLVGISPALTGGSVHFDAYNTRIYAPDYNGSSKTWSPTVAAVKGWRSWGDIPYCNTAPTGTRDRYDDTVIKSAYNTLSNWQAGRGDICQFIDPEYRLPYHYEFGDGRVGSGWTKYGSWNWNVSEASDKTNSEKSTVDGKTSIDPCVCHDKTGYCFPASGIRDYTGKLQLIWNSATYWSGSAYSNTEAYCLPFLSSNNGSVQVEPFFFEDDRQFGHTIRCVKQ